MAAGERIQQPVTMIQERFLPDGTRVTTTTADARCGDPVFLETAMHALAEMRKVLYMDEVPLVGEGGMVVMQQDVHQHQNYVCVIVPPSGWSWPGR